MSTLYPSNEEPMGVRPGPKPVPAPRKSLEQISDDYRNAGWKVETITPGMVEMSKPVSPKTAVKPVPEKSHIPCRGPACKERVLVLWGERKEYCCFDCEDWARLLGVNK